jgi:hypothetical protein
MSDENELKYLVAFSRIPGIGKVRLSQIEQFFPGLIMPGVQQQES